MQTKFSIISNSIFKYFIIFAISFLWLNFYSQNLLVVALISIIIAIVVGQLIYLISKHKKNLINLSIKEKEKMKYSSTQLLLASEKEICTFFHIILKTNRDCQISKSKDYIEWDNHVFIPFYEKETLLNDDIRKIFKKHNNVKNIIIACIDCDEKAYTLANKIKQTTFTILNEQQTFNLFKKYNFYPDFNIELNKKEKFKYSNLKTVAFKKANAKHYFFSGILILITSFFIRYNIYYLIFATLLFVFSGISYFKTPIKQVDIIDEL